MLFTHSKRRCQACGAAVDVSQFKRGRCARCKASLISKADVRIAMQLVVGAIVLGVLLVLAIVLAVALW